MFENLRELWRYKELAWHFVLRDIKGRYKQTFFGVLWAVIQPLFLMFVFQIVFSKFLKVDSGGVPYALFSYVALLPWLHVSKSLSAGLGSLGAFKAVITKIYFPREIVPISVVLSNLVDFFISSGVFAMMMVIYRVEVTWHLLFVLLILPVQVMLAMAISLFFSGLSAIFRDLKFAIPLFIQVWMYGSPVIYGMDGIQSKYLPLFYLNPLTGIIESYRQIILFHNMPAWNYLAVSAGFTVIFLWFSYWLFKRLEKFFIDII